MILFLLDQHPFSSSSGACNLASSALSPTGSLSHDEPWSSSAFLLLVHFYGQFTPTCLCSPQSMQHRVSLLSLLLPLALAFVSNASVVAVTVPVGFAALRVVPFLPPSSLLPLVHSSAPLPRCHTLQSSRPFLACSLAYFVPIPSDCTYIVI